MTRFARDRRVFFFEEPIWDDGPPRLATRICPNSGVFIVTPVLPLGLSTSEISSLQRHLLGVMLIESGLTTYMAWYYTPMAMEFTSVLDPVLTVYDCMDELTAFAGAPPAMKTNEAALFQQADLVFTGGACLFASKRQQHPSVYLFPSSVDTKHFRQALSITTEPADQAAIPQPRLGYAGVIDERMDFGLLAEVARARPEWQIVLVGPVVKISPDSIPQVPNIHLLGMKQYSDLPAYFAGWTIGILPFAMNESTKFISPTKTPEYLAAGLRVISTPIRDVVSPYGDQGFVTIADGPAEFIAAGDEILEQHKSEDFVARVTEFLGLSSWDKTWSEMDALIANEYLRKLPNASEATSMTPSAAVISSGEVR